MAGEATGGLLECVINISEGCDLDTARTIASGGGSCLLDLHSDPWHNRSVLTLGGPPADLQAGVRRVAELAVRLLDLRSHTGAHPRLGALDVVPFVDLDAGADQPVAAAAAAQHAFAVWAGDELELPCFYYGADRSLPELRRFAFTRLCPDTGPWSPHPRAGACCVGVRPVLIAYNVWLDAGRGATLDDAESIARRLRSPAVRSLGFDLAGEPQVSCNLIAPMEVGPAEVYDAVAALAPVDHAELVGLLPRAVLERTPEKRWPELALSPERTIESRLAAAGVANGSAAAC
jgi:glutamate formiminotransferase